MASYPATYNEAASRVSGPWSASFALAQPISLGVIVLLAVTIHAPLLMMQLPMQSLDATNHIFFAQHYNQSWFQPWNEKWFGGFSQTTAPPLAHQWIALLSLLMSVRMAYMFVQLLAIVILVIGVFRFSRVWVGGHSAPIAAMATIFLGSLALLVYQAGQLPATLATALLLNALAYLYSWARDAALAAMLKGAIIFILAATSDHITFFAGTLLFGLPVILLAIADRQRAHEKATSARILSRTVIFFAIGIGGIAIAMLPFWIHFFSESVRQLPAPHGSRDNFLFHGRSALNFWVVPFGALILALPFVFRKGASEGRLVPLFMAFFAALLLGLGGTTPVAPWVLGDAYQSLTLDRFTFWATLLALPIVGLFGARLIRRYELRAAIALFVTAALGFSLAFAWMNKYTPSEDPLRTSSMVEFLGRDGHDRYRYLTLGFGYNFAAVSMSASARTVDGAFSGGRLLPEMKPYGWARLDQARHYGSAGMEALRAVLKHANNYGLKYIFVRDRYYEPLLAFAGWRQVESHDSGAFSIWGKEDVPMARPMGQGLQIPAVQRYLWGIVPMALSLAAIFLLVVWRDRRKPASTIVIPTGQSVELREAN